MSTHEVEHFTFEDCTGDCGDRKITEDELHNMSMWLYIKDKFNISNEAWRELSMKSDETPCLNKMIKQMNNINEKWDLKPTSGGIEGIQISFQESITEEVKRLHSAGVLKPSKTVQVKISGDGTKIGKRINVVNITYTIINEKNVAMSEKGNYLLAVLKVKESYENLSEGLSDLIKEIEQTKTVKLGDISYQLEYFLGGDWKFLASVCGIGGANADFACIWCTCPKEKRHDIKKTWSILDPDSGARTLEKIKTNAKSHKYNCINTPLFSFIPLNHVVIDTLHLYLRISDNLIELLIRQLKICDNIHVEKKKIFTDNFCRMKYKHMAEYEKFLQSLGIPFQFFVGKASKHLEYRDLTGPEKVKLFKHINIANLLPNCPEGDVAPTQQLWNDFSSIISDLKQDVKLEDVGMFKLKVTNWMKLFLHIYQTKDVTPYMHAFFPHVHEFLSLYGNIEYFSQQGLEKYNDLTSKNFFRSTNHRGVSAIQQLFFKRKRVQSLEAAGCARMKRSYTCSNCKENGHTIKTCTAKCCNCAQAICCAHLVKIDGKYKTMCTTNL